MSVRLTRRVALAALAAGLVGCAPTSSPTNAASSPTMTKLIDAGGGGRDITPAFTTAGTVVIDYHLSQPPQDPRITFVAERDAGGGAYQAAATVTQPAPAGLAGTVRLALIPGRYRLRVDTDAPWTAVVSEPQP